MTARANSILIATICNTIKEASPFALWISDGANRYVADLSGHVRGGGGFTGLAYNDNRLYLAVQANEPCILVLDMALNVIATISDDRFRDLHSLHAAGSALYIASPGNGAIFRHDLATGQTSVEADFGREPWVAGVHAMADDVWICCHNLHFIDPAARGGGVYSVRERRTIVDGLGKPHSLIAYRDGWVVLDSIGSRVVYFDRQGIGKILSLDGWLRGAAIGHDGKLIVASGPHRLVSRKNPDGAAARGMRDFAGERLLFHELDGGNPTRSYLPEVPGFEIYDLLVLPNEATLTPAADRIVPVRRGMFARMYYAALMSALAG